MQRYYSDAVPGTEGSRRRGSAYDECGGARLPGQGLPLPPASSMHHGVGIIPEATPVPVRFAGRCRGRSR